MRLTRLLQATLGLFRPLYSWLHRLKISIHQVVTLWRFRIRRTSLQTHETTLSDTAGSTELRAIERREPFTLELSTTTTTTTTSTTTSTDKTLLTKLKTSPKRVKFFSFLLRLSPRKLMDYCVIALNEASSSGSANKFDLSSCDRPVWLLGKQYNLPEQSDELVNDIRTKLWITYRRNFPPIDENSRYTTDRGFGCMIRCGQMVLANALIYKSLGRDWRWSPLGLSENPQVYIKILKLFQDKEECPYSIHNIVRTGQQEGKVVGEWFGPNTIAQALKRIASNLRDTELQDNNNYSLISIDAALDNVVVVDEVKAKFRDDSSCARPKNAHDNQDYTTDTDSFNGQSPATRTSRWIPGILFIQLRLGLSKINPLYFDALKKTFHFKSSLGIIGGRPNHALYLIGYTDDDIIHLDPHSTQQSIDFDSSERQQQILDKLSDDSILPIDSTYHCANPEKMSIDKLDPSLALCFYFHEEEEFDDWCVQSNNLLIKSEQAPMFEIAPTRPSSWSVSVKTQFVKSSSSVKSGLTPAIKTSDGEAFIQLAPCNEGETLVVKKGPGGDKSSPDNSFTSNDDEGFEMLG